MASAIVCGAGIVGSALTYELSRRGVAVTVIDPGGVCERGASRWGFGGTAWASAFTPATIEFARRGFNRYFELSEELPAPIEFRPGESLMLLRNQDEMDRASASAKEFRARGHQARVIGSGLLAPMEPNLDFSTFAGALCCLQGHLHVTHAARTLVASATGATVRDDLEVLGFLPGGEGVMTSGGPVHADTVFVCSGAWTRQLLGAAGFELPVLHSTAEFLVSDPVPRFIERGLSWDLGARTSAETAAGAPVARAAWDAGSAEPLTPMALEGGLVQFLDGHVRVGQVSRMVPAMPAAADPSSIEPLLAGAEPLFAGVRKLPNLRLEYRPVAFTPDHLPVVGILPGLPHVVAVATSQSPLVLAPAIGASLADWAMTGTWDPLLDEWAPGRDSLAEWIATPAAVTGV